MFFVLSKIVESLLAPVFWVFALMLAGLLVKRQALKKRLLVTAVVVFFIFSNDFLATECMTFWEIPAIQDSAVKGKYDVAIVLGGITDYDPSMHRIQFEHGADRLFHALRLYKMGKVKKILLDGGSGSLDKSNVEAPFLRQYLLDIGVPDSVICIEPRSRNTRENALFVKPLLDSIAPNGRYLICTSAYHMRRAMGCFNKAGIHALPFAVDRLGGPLKFQFDYIFIPDERALYIWEVFLHEWVGYLTYKMAGYL